MADEFPFPAPDDVELPDPWTPEQIAAWNKAHNAFQPGEAAAWHAARNARAARLKELSGKGVDRMTPKEKDEALTLLLANS